MFTVPPFVQLQLATPPLRGLWNVAPREGDRYLSAEIDWIDQTNTLTAVAFAVHGNSPVALSQIVALYVDNSRCNSDVSFQFPDTNFELVVAAHNQGLYPVLTNALSFFAVAAQCASGDVTIVQILNSMPPPIAIISTASATVAAASQQHASGVMPAVTGTTNIVPSTVVSGTLNTIQINFALGNVAGAHGTFTLIDGQSRMLWSAGYTIPAGQTYFQPVVSLASLSIRFNNGIYWQVTSSTFDGPSSSATVNLYYSTP